MVLGGVELGTAKHPWLRVEYWSVSGTLERTSGHLRRPHCDELCALDQT